MKFAKINDTLFTTLEKYQMTGILGGKFAGTQLITGFNGTNGQTDASGADWWPDYSDIDFD